MLQRGPRILDKLDMPIEEHPAASAGMDRAAFQGGIYSWNGVWK